MSGNDRAVVQGDFEHHWQAAVLKQRPLILPRRHYVYPREAEEVERGALEVFIQPGLGGELPSSEEASLAEKFPGIREGPSKKASLLTEPMLRVPYVSNVRSRSGESPDLADLVPKPSSATSEPFLATCALGYADPLAPTGVWACPDPHQLCAVAGGYAYLINTRKPECFEQVAYRPVLAVLAVASPSPGVLLFVGNQAIVAYGTHGLQWEAPRLSDEGVTVHSIAGGLLRGAGWEMRTDRETPFALDLRTGSLVALDHPTQ